MTAPRFPASCRRVLVELDAFAIDLARHDSHLDECASCRGMVAAARRQAEILRRVLPCEAESPLPARETLQQIHERANEAYESALGHALRAALGPVRAPGDVAWVEMRPSIVEQPLDSAMKPARSPGWMWQRVRAATKPQTATPPVIGRFATAAAVLVAAALGIRAFSFQELPEGTTAAFTVVFTESPDALDRSFSLDAFLEEGR